MSTPNFEEQTLAQALKTPVSAIMSRDVLCVRPDLSVASLARIFLEKGISGVPVVDEKGAPIGVVSKTDVLRENYETEGKVEYELLYPDEDLEALEAADELGSPVGVGDIMMPFPLSVREDVSVLEVSELMATRRIHRAPVVSDDGKVVGLLSSLDVLRWIATVGSGSRR